MARRFLTLLLTLSAVALLAAGCGDDDDDGTDSTPVEPGFGWVGRPAGTTNYMLDIRAVGQGFVAVGENGAILVSTDGSTLRQPLTPTNNDLFGVTWFMDNYIAVGDSLTVLVSSSPGTGFSKLDLSGLDLDDNTWLYGTASDGSEVIAVGRGGAIIRSSNGTDWETLDSNFTVLNLYGATWSDAQSKYVIVGAAGLIMTSSDGQEWAFQSSGTSAYLYDVTWSDELSEFIACGQGGTVLTSPDGIDWSVVENRPDAYFYGLAWSGTELVLLGQDGWLLTTPDVASFTLRSGPNVDLRSVEWSSEQSRFIAVGNLQTVTTSADGAEWTEVYDGVAVDLHGVMAIVEDTDTSLMAVGTQGTILKSDDGLSFEFVWARQGIQLNAMVRRAGTAVAVGQQGYVLRSPDFMTWDTVETRPTFLDLNSVATSSDRFVAVGENGTIIESTDGSVWNSVAWANELSLFDVIWDGSRFMAVGDSGLVITSTDGQTWNQSYLPVADSLRGVTQIGDTGYVAVGLSGSIHYSTTGSSWEEAAWDATGDPDLLSVTASESAVVACGVNGYRIASTDGGMTWETVAAGTGIALRDVAWDGTRFTAVGDNIYILTSP